MYGKILLAADKPSLLVLSRQLFDPFNPLIPCITLKGNISDVNPISYVINDSVGGGMTADISDNVGTVQTLGA